MAEDEVVMELDVVISPNADLHLLQYPLRPRYRPYGDQGSLKSASVSGENLNLTYKLNSNNINFDKTNNEFKQDAQGLSGKPIVPINKYFAGLIKDGIFHIVPLQKIYQVRPDTSHLDAVLDKRQIEDAEEVALLKQEKESKKLRVFKKKAVKEEEAQQDTRNLTCHDMYSDLSKNAVTEICSQVTGTCSFMKQADYLAGILPPSVGCLGFKDRIRALPVILGVEELLKEVAVVSTGEVLEFFPDESAKGIEAVLAQKATVVRGRWVRKSEVLKEGLARDVCIYLLKNGEILRQKYELDRVKEIIGQDPLKILNELCVFRDRKWLLKGNEGTM